MATTSYLMFLMVDDLLYVVAQKNFRYTGYTSITGFASSPVVEIPKYLSFTQKIALLLQIIIYYDRHTSTDVSTAEPVLSDHP